MKYERLTERNEYGRAILKNEKVNKDIAELNLNFSTVLVLDKIVSQFCDLEDKIEDGTLVELPCKVGDEVYIIAKRGLDIYDVEKIIVADIWYSETDNRLYPITADECPMSEIFLTKAEAEKRLEELIS